MDRSDQFEVISPEQEAQEFLDSLGGDHTSHQTRPFIMLLRKLIRSGDWEPDDSGKHQIWHLLKKRLEQSAREDEGEWCAKLLLALRDQDLAKAKVTIELLDRMMGVAPAPLVNIDMTGDGESNEPPAAQPQSAGISIKEIVQQMNRKPAEPAE